MSTYFANEKYSAVLTSGYTVGQTTLYVSAVPNNVPTIIVAAKGTDNETIFEVTGKTTNSLTGVSRLRGANVDLDAQTPLTCLNNEEFINQLASVSSVFNEEHDETGKHTTDQISEKTEDAGVTVDGLLIKDGRVAGWDGWMPAEETWTYASANTFTISGDKTGKYQKGDKIKLTNSTVKYFYVIGVSYSDPNTTVTVTGGSDYALASGTITNNYYSKIENPQGFPRINVTPSSYSGEGSMTYTSVTKDYCYLRITGSICEIIFAFMGTTGGTASANIIISFASGTIPTPARNQWDGDVQYTDQVIAGCGNSVILTSRDLHVRKYNYSNWGIGGNKRITGIQTYYF